MAHFSPMLSPHTFQEWFLASLHWFVALKWHWKCIAWNHTALSLILWVFTKHRPCFACGGLHPALDSTFHMWAKHLINISWMNESILTTSITVLSRFRCVLHSAGIKSLLFSFFFFAWKARSSAYMEKKGGSNCGNGEGTMFFFPLFYLLVAISQVTSA